MAKLRNLAGIICKYIGKGSGVFGDTLVEIGGDFYEVWKDNVFEKEGRCYVRGFLMESGPESDLVAITQANDLIRLWVDREQVVDIS